jgi:hypothetical protein
MIAQGDKTRCAPQSQLICGTGGCVFAAFRVGKAGVRKLYDDQAHSWRLDASANPPVLRFHVHGSRCGGFGPDPCETVVDLRTGAKRTGKPKD